MKRLAHKVAGKEVFLLVVVIVMIVAASALVIIAGPVATGNVVAGPRMLYVAAECSSSAGCREDLPCCSVDEAVEQARPGDVIVVAGQQYKVISK
ncbi:MAG: hypothetical protein ABIH41_03630 [Nanoarchaeota archaeon]